MIISNLSGNTGEQLLYNCSFSWHWVSADCIESEWTFSTGFLLFLLPLHPHPPQRILCSTSALAMFEPGLGSCCRLDWGERGMEGWKAGEKREKEKWERGLDRWEERKRERQIKYNFPTINRYEETFSNSWIPWDLYDTEHHSQHQWQWGEVAGLFTDWENTQLLTSQHLEAVHKQFMKRNKNTLIVKCKKHLPWSSHSLRNSYWINLLYIVMISNSQYRSLRRNVLIVSAQTQHV